MPKTIEQQTTEAGRVYVGVRTGDGPGDTAVYVEQGGCRWPLRHVVHHSPSGLSWGYGGSGPADTALSILADALGERPTPAPLRRGAPRCWRGGLTSKVKPGGVRSTHPSTMWRGGMR